MEITKDYSIPFKLDKLSTKVLIKYKEYFEQELKVKCDVPVETIYLPNNIREVDKWQMRKNLDLYNELTSNIEQINKELEKRKNQKGE